MLPARIPLICQSGCRVYYANSNELALAECWFNGRKGFINLQIILLVNANGVEL